MNLLFNFSVMKIFFAIGILLLNFNLFGQNTKTITITNNSSVHDMDIVKITSAEDNSSRYPKFESQGIIQVASLDNYVMSPAFHSSPSNLGKFPFFHLAFAGEQSFSGWKKYSSSTDIGTLLTQIQAYQDSSAPTQVFEKIRLTVNNSTIDCFVTAVYFYEPVALPTWKVQVLKTLTGGTTVTLYDN